MSSRSDDPFEKLQREVERLCHDMLYHRHPASHFAVAVWSPAADVVVEADTARVLFELAGVPREHVRLRLVGRALEVSGRRTPPQEPDGAHYHRAEIYFGEFQRAVELPWDADPDRIEAVYRDGVLEVRVQRAPIAPLTEITVEEIGGL